jgi:hypothetical protein
MARDEYFGEGSGASASSVVRLVSYARGDGKAVADCHSILNGCKAVFYFDYNHPYASSAGCNYQPDVQYLAAASESWFVHWPGYTDSAHRVYGKGPPGSMACTIYDMNPNSSGVQGWWLNYLQTNADNYDIYYLDDDAADVVDATYFPSGGGCPPWPSYCYSTQEIPNNAAEAQARANFVNAMSHSNGDPMYFFSNGGILPDLPYTDRMLGESCEGCIANDSSAVVPSNYIHELNELATMDGTSAASILISKGHWPSGSATQILQRMVTIGVAWLGYKEGHTIVMANLEDQTSNLAVWPEELIYPSGPVESMNGDASGIQVASGVWRREFTTCYQSGVYFGRCAAIVNSTGSAVTVASSWLTQRYGHLITMSGGDVLNGGIANVLGGSFTPGTTQIPAGSALLLAQ